MWGQGWNTELDWPAPAFGTAHRCTHMHRAMSCPNCSVACISHFTLSLADYWLFAHWYRPSFYCSSEKSGSHLQFTLFFGFPHLDPQRASTSNCLPLPVHHQPLVYHFVGHCCPLAGLLVSISNLLERVIHTATRSVLLMLKSILLFSCFLTPQTKAQILLLMAHWSPVSLCPTFSTLNTPCLLPLSLECPSAPLCSTHNFKLLRPLTKGSSEASSLTILLQMAPHSLLYLIFIKALLWCYVSTYLIYQSSVIYLYLL